MVGEFVGLLRAPQRRVSPWTKPRLRLLRRRWTQGARVREIAAAVRHGLTSNAVIAKIPRLGIARLSPYAAPARRPPPRKAPGLESRPHLHLALRAFPS